LAGWLEPSHDAGGDSFDYSLDREFLYASLTDAMGHSTEAALLATLTVATLRNQRRALASPVQQAESADATLKAGARPDQFVTRPAASRPALGRAGGDRQRRSPALSAPGRPGQATETDDSSPSGCGGRRPRLPPLPPPESEPTTTTQPMTPASKTCVDHAMASTPFVLALRAPGAGC
jgi:hypothetical protein